MSATIKPKEVFFWGGEDNEDLFCVCGTPHPVQIFNDELPGLFSRRCSQCGAMGDLDEGSGDWIVRMGSLYPHLPEGFRECAECCEVFVADSSSDAVECGACASGEEVEG